MNYLKDKLKTLIEEIDTVIEDACVWFVYQPAKKKIMLALTAYTINTMAVLWLF